MKIKIMLFFLAFGTISIFSSWGFLVHRTINQLAIYKLPKKMETFFYHHKDYLVKNSVRPDERRNTDSAEAPKHFIDLEAYGDSAAWKMPLLWKDAIIVVPKDSLLKYGYVPYWIITVQGQLTNSFKNRNSDSILYYAAELAHYIGDANVPLHTSLNYDGQLTDQKGLHSLWESMIPELHLNSYQLSNKHKAKYLQKPEEAIWNYIRHAHTLLPQLFQQEIEVSRDFTDSTKYRYQVRNGRTSRSYSTAFAKAYSKKLEPTINQQLLRSSDLIADFWFTAWVDGGKPDLNVLIPKFTSVHKKELKMEKKAYKKNQLIEKNLLNARKKTAPIKTDQ